MSNDMITQAMIEPMKPLTVIQVDHHIAPDEAQQIHGHFRDAVQDDRPMIIIGPDIDVMMIEPYRTIARRGWVAVVLATLAFIVSLILLVWVLMT